MVAHDKVAAIRKVMHEFDVQFELLKTEYRAKIRKILDKAEKEKMERLRAELKK